MDKIEIKKEIRTPVQTIDEYILQHPLVLQERMIGFYPGSIAIQTQSL